MIYCTKCGNPLQEDSRFCSACGTPVQAPISPEPQMPSDSAPVSVSAPAPAKKGSFVPAIVSLALSGEAISFGIVTLYFGFLALVASFTVMGEDAFVAGIMALIYCIVFGLFGVAFGVVSLILGVKYLKTKNPRLSGLAKAGVIISAISLVMIILGCLATAVSALLIFLEFTTPFGTPRGVFSVLPQKVYISSLDTGKSL